MMEEDMHQDMSASAKPTGLGAPEGAEPDTRLGATPAIPCARVLLALSAEAEHVRRLDSLTDLLRETRRLRESIEYNDPDSARLPILIRDEHRLERMLREFPRD